MDCNLTSLHNAMLIYIQRVYVSPQGNLSIGIRGHTHLEYTEIFKRLIYKGSIRRTVLITLRTFGGYSHHQICGHVMKYSCHNRGMVNETASYICVEENYKNPKQLA